ncbi:3-methyladenine DNA glycosylase [Bacillus sp. FSL K6-3431]
MNKKDQTEANNSVEQDMKEEMGMDIEPQRATNEKDPKKNKRRSDR